MLLAVFLTINNTDPDTPQGKLKNVVRVETNEASALQPDGDLSVRVAVYDEVSVLRECAASRNAAAAAAVEQVSAPLHFSYDSRRQTQTVTGKAPFAYAGGSCVGGPPNSACAMDRFQSLEPAQVVVVVTRGFAAPGN